MQTRTRQTCEDEYSVYRTPVRIQPTKRAVLLFCVRALLRCRYIRFLRTQIFYFAVRVIHAAVV